MTRKTTDRILENDTFLLEATTTELIGFVRELHVENMNLKEENIRRTSHRLHDFLSGEYLDLDRLFGLLLCAALGALGTLGITLLVMVAFNRELKPEFYTEMCPHNGGANIMQVVTWGEDLNSSQCIEDPKALLELLEALREGARK